MPFPLESLEQMQGFFWVLIRVSIILFLMPIFGAKGVPHMWKVGLSLIIAIILTPVVPLPKSFPETTPEVILGIFSEVIMGLIMVFVVKVLFASVQLAGQFMVFQMGFGMARAMDPVTGVQSTALSQFLYLITILVFFALDGHHLFIRALATSFYSVPPNSFSLNPSLSHVLVKTSSEMFLIALKIASPVMVALFLSNLCLGIVARTVPQVNILMVGFPINIGLGLIIYGLILRNLSPFLFDLTKRIGEVLSDVIHLM